MLRQIGLVILALSSLVVTGCHVGCCSKRASEKKCPTDIRKMHCWCFGEDALFRYPCGPNQVFHGHKATCWREWPTSASHWRDVHCGPPMGGYVPEEGQVIGWPQNVAPAPVEGGGGVPNPFREEQPQVTPQPLPPQDGPATTSYTPSQIQEVMEHGVRQAEATLPAPPPTGTSGADMRANIGELAGARITPAVSSDSPTSASSLEPKDSTTGVPNVHQEREFRQWSAFAELGATAPARQELMPEVSTLFAAPALPEPVAAVASRPAVAAHPRPAVPMKSPPEVAAASARLAERDPRWRLVVHDSPNGLPVQNNAGASRFRPPHHAGARGQSPTVQQRRAAPPKSSLEEQTRAALQRFISIDRKPGAAP